MTHKDIYTKFMIEYDKANVTSSYPSLTEYEVATVLDKAYNALIAQKVTGNNVRRSSVESDVKSISDLQPLVMHAHPVFVSRDATVEYATNVATFNLPSDFLYFVQLYLTQKVRNTHAEGLVEDAVSTPQPSAIAGNDANDTVQGTEVGNESSSEDVQPDDVYQDDNHEPSEYIVENERNPYDKQRYRAVPAKLVPHQIAEKFFTSTYNMPWIKNPVVYIENGTANVVYDLLNAPLVASGDRVHFIYIKKPNTFVKDLNAVPFTNNNVTGVSFFDCPASNAQAVKDLYEFECNDTVAEELISLAVSFALENVESGRLNSKLNMRGLEA